MNKKNRNRLIDTENKLIVTRGKGDWQTGCHDQHGVGVPDWGGQKMKKRHNRGSLRKSGDQVGHRPLMDRQ